jgi:arginyl-tRNA synthetase
MISFRGNTGPYLQYATARIRSIFRRLDQNGLGDTSTVLVAEPAERALALRLLGFGAAVASVAETAEPHSLCSYLFDVASLFTTFYEQCPVLKAPSEQVRASRLALCALTLRVLTFGLDDLLGVPIPDQM